MHLTEDETTATHVFQGESGKAQTDKFYKNLKNSISSLISDGVALGATESELGTHSIRKLADTFAVNQPGGPSVDCVKMRAGHSNGKVQDCYAKADKAGDCFVGRVLTMMSMTNADFALLPPHFDDDGSIGWNDICQLYSKFDEKFKLVMPYLLATLIYHEEKGNLATLLDADHPIFMQNIFRRQYHKTLLPYIHLGVNVNSQTSMRATGLSPHVVTLIRLKEVEKSLELQSSQIENLHKAEVNILEGIPKKVADAVDDLVKLGDRDLSQQYMFNRLDSLMDPLVDRMARIESTLDNRSAEGIPEEVGTNRNETWGSNGHYHFWNGMFHVVPLNYKVPSYRSYEHWKLWHFGALSMEIGPHKYIKPRYDLIGKLPRDKLNRVSFCKIAKVMNILTQSWGDRSVTEANCDDAFAYGYDRLIKQLYGANNSNKIDINCKTLFNRLRKNNIC